MKPTDISAELTLELARRFGRWEDVPTPLQETVWLIHMQMMEAEHQIEYFRERLAAYTAPPAPAAGNVARLLLSESIVLEVEVGSPYKRAGVLYEKVTFDPQALTAPGVVELLSTGRAVPLRKPDGSERLVRITDAGAMWQGKLFIAS